MVARRAVPKRTPCSLIAAYSQETTRQLRLSSSNQKLQRRRRIFQSLNKLLKEVGVETLRLDAKQARPDESFERVLQVLKQRCGEGPPKDQLRALVAAWLADGGTLPAGMRLNETQELLVTSDETEFDPLVLGHRVLRRTYCLKSQAFMVTYHSASITVQDWDDFREHIERFARRRGARA